MAYRYQEETVAEYRKLPAGVVNAQAAMIGMHEYEPLVVCFDAMLRYAKAYEKSVGEKIGTDGVLGDAWEEVIRGVRMLLNGDGAVAMELGRTTDSKDNGMCEALYWECCRVGGINGD